MKEIYLKFRRAYLFHNKNIFRAALKEFMKYIISNNIADKRFLSKYGYTKFEKPIYFDTVDELRDLIYKDEVTYEDILASIDYLERIKTYIKYKQSLYEIYVGAK